MNLKSVNILILVINHYRDIGFTTEFLLGNVMNYKLLGLPHTGEISWFYFHNIILEEEICAS